MSKFIPKFTKTNINSLTLTQDKTIDGYRLLKDGKELYYIISKKATTRGFYIVHETVSGDPIAEIVRDQIKYLFSTKYQNNTISTIELAEKKLLLTIAENKLLGNVLVRGKIFEFKENGELKIAVDKQVISLNDKYTISYIEDYDPISLVCVPIAIDEFFHSGTID